HLRSRVRHEVIPALEAVFPGARRRLVALAERSRGPLTDGGAGHPRRSGATPPPSASPARGALPPALRPRDSPVPSANVIAAAASPSRNTEPRGRSRGPW